MFLWPSEQKRPLGAAGLSALLGNDNPFLPVLGMTRLNVLQDRHAAQNFKSMLGPSTFTAYNLRRMLPSWHTAKVNIYLQRS